MDLTISQNFLNNTLVLKELLKKSEISENDVVLDVGAGTGTISVELAKIAKKVYAIDYDKGLETTLRSKVKGLANVQVVPANFLKYTLPENNPYKVFSNIPFSITSDIINKLVFAKNPPEDTFLFVQKEAALRYLGIGEGTMISLLIIPFFDVEVIYEFNKNDFTPKPSVNVVLLRIKKRAKPLIKTDDAKEFRNFIVYTMWQQKSTLKLRLSKIFTATQFHRLSKDLDFRIDAQSTELQLEQWISLFMYYLDGVSPEKKNVVNEAGENYFRNRIKQSGPSRTKIRR